MFTKNTCWKINFQIHFKNMFSQHSHLAIVLRKFTKFCKEITLQNKFKKMKTKWKKCK